MKQYFTLNYLDKPLYHSPDTPTEGQLVKAVVPTDHQSV